MANEEELYQLLLDSRTKEKQKTDVALHNQFQQSITAPKKEHAPAHISIPGKTSPEYKKPLANRALEAVADPIYNALTQTRTGAAFAGLGEGEYQSLASIAHLFNKEAMPDLNLKEHIEPEYQGYQKGGNLAGNLLVDYGLMRGAGGALRGATGAAGLASRMGASAGIGYATGEQFPEQFGGRIGAAALGALFPVTAGATKNQIGQNVMQAAENAEARYGGRIGEVLSQAAPVRPRYTHAMQDIVNGTHNVGQEYGLQGLVTDFLTNPSAQTAQNAMSAMKRAQREMLNFTHPRVSHLPEASQRAYRALGDAIGSLERQIESSLTPELFRQYRQALREYAGNAAPYVQPAIRGARAGTGPASNIPKAIEGMEKYSRTLPPEIGQEGINQFQFLMQQHPELFLNQHKGKIATGIGALTGAGTYLDKLMGGGE